MEKILIKFNEIAFNFDKARIKTAVETLAYFFDDLRSLCDIDISNDIFQELIFSNDCNATEQAIKEKISNDLQKAGIKIKSIHVAAEREGLEGFYKLYNVFAQKRSVFYEAWNYLAIDKNKLIAKPGFENELREKYSLYVTSEAGKALREQHLKYVEAANDFLKQMPETKRNLIAQSWDFDNENDNLKAREWDYDFLTKVV